MRLGAWLDETAGGPDVPPSAVAAAERAGVFGVLLDTDLGIARAAEIAVTTTDIRVVVRVQLGSEHPVTLAEEVAVLDHLSCGRAVCVADAGSLTVAEALEDLTVLRLSWSARMFRHEGRRWTIPSGMLGEDLPRSVSVTPKPAQLDIPVWLDGAVAGELRKLTGLPVLARKPTVVDSGAQVQPAVAALSGQLDADRRLVTEWSVAGATHLLLAPPVRAAQDYFPSVVARYLQPEVAMPMFPRIMAESELPDPWSPPS